MPIDIYGSGGSGGSGDVTGPASSTDNAVARYDSVTGKVIQNSTVIISDAGVISGGSISGDDVTIDNTGFEVLTGDNSQTLWEQNDTALLQARGTEVLGGTGDVTFTIGTTVFDVAATIGQIKDSTGYYAIDYAGATGVSVVSTIVSSIWVYLDNAGTLQQQTTAPTNEEYRQKLFLTRLALSAGTLAGQEELANPAGNYTNSLRDFASYFASPKKGLDISANADLTFQVAAGSIFELGIMNAEDEDNPNEVTFTSQDPASFFYLDRDTTLATGQTSINVTQYDNNGTLTTLTNNRFKIMTVYKFGSGNHVVQEGQAQYMTLDAAQTAISTRTFINNPAVDTGTRIGWIIVQKDATDLTDTATARIVQDTGSFGTSVTTVGALLSANNLSDVSDASTSRTNLGLAIGTNVQAYDAGLSDIAGLSVTDGNIIVGNGSNWVAENGETARTSLGLGSSSDVTFNTVNGRDVDVDGDKLDGIEALADVTDEVSVVGSLNGATLSSVTAATDDKVIIQDTSDSDNIKTVTAQSIADLAASVVGEIRTHFGIANIPDNELICNGGTFSAVTYPALNTFLGGTTLPDLRGEFLRGADQGRGVDTGRVIGSSQADELKAHTHTYSNYRYQPNGGPAGWVGGDNDVVIPNSTTSSTGGTETRPRNVAVIYTIIAE